MSEQQFQIHCFNVDEMEWRDPYPFATNSVEEVEQQIIEDWKCRWGSAVTTDRLPGGSLIVSVYGRDFMYEIKN